MNAPTVTDPPPAQGGASIHSLLCAGVAAALLLFGGAASAAGTAAPDATAKSVVLFDGVAMVQAAEGKKSGEHWREFIPADEDLKSWTRFASIHEFAKVDDPTAAARSRVEALKRQYPQAHSGVLRNKTTGEVIVDFITSPADHKYVEFDVYRYSRNPKGGVIAQQYALRRYEYIPDFAEAFKSERHRLVNLMATHGLTVQ